MPRGGRGAEEKCVHGWEGVARGEAMRSSKVSGVSAITLEDTELYILKGKFHQPLMGHGEKSHTSGETELKIVLARGSDHKPGKPMPVDLWFVCLKLGLCLCVDRCTHIQHLQRPEKGVGSPGAGAADNC